MKLQSALYKPFELEVEVENPYNEAGEFRVSLVESSVNGGLILNPFNPNAAETIAEKKASMQLKQASKGSFDYQRRKPS